MIVITTILCAYLQRLSGGGAKNDILQAILLWAYAAVLGLAMGAYGWGLLVFCVTFIIGKQVAPWTSLFNQILWGRILKDTDRDIGWYQTAFINEPWTAALVRGFIWGAPSLLVCIWHPQLIMWPFAATIGFALSLYIAQKYTSADKGWTWAFSPATKGKWGKVEVIRGALFGFMASLIGFMA